MKWSRDPETGNYNADDHRTSIRKDKAVVYHSSRPRTITNWLIMRDGEDFEGYGSGYDTLREAREHAEGLFGVTHAS